MAGADASGMVRPKGRSSQWDTHGAPESLIPAGYGTSSVLWQDHHIGPDVLETLCAALGLSRTSLLSRIS